MKNFGKVRSSYEPKKITISASQVFIASNIMPYSELKDEYNEKGYEYDYVVYDKDEYIELLSEQSEQLQSELLDTQSALCNVYELLNDGGI